MFRLLLSLLLISSIASGQNKVVEGRVVDATTDLPVPFASIGIMGTSKGTSSNLNGQFSLSVAGNFSIRVSCLGYETIEAGNLSIDSLVLIRLKPTTTQLKELVVFNKQINPRRLVQKAFRSISTNFNTQPFAQNFFYRHYCKDDSVYGRLIEASVDVWKRKGYRSLETAAGIGEEIRVTQLRRSFDKTAMAQGHVPIAIKSILQADIAGYQMETKSEHLSFFSEVSNLKVDIDKYAFTFEGLTYYDGKEVYEIAYSLKKDSVQTTTGYMIMPGNSGSLFITTDDHVFVKLIDVKFWGADTIKTTSYYTPYKGKYYPYHLIRDGKSVARDNSTHWFHVELMATEILTDSYEHFKSKEPGKIELLKIPYDSAFWSSNTILKTTPLEDQIIDDLGGGKSLNEQFYLYQQYELNRIESGENGEEKFNWFIEDSKGKRILYIGFWKSDCVSCIQELEYAKRLLRRYKDKITFILVSLDDEDKSWKNSIARYNLSLGGFLHYRIGSESATALSYDITVAPRYLLIDKDGSVFDLNAKSPANAQLRQDFDLLISGNHKE